MVDHGNDVAAGPLSDPVLEAKRVDAIKESDERPAKKMERALTGGHVRHRLFVYN